jgi:hypothetical protein
MNDMTIRKVKLAALLAALKEVYETTGVKYIDVTATFQDDEDTLMITPSEDDDDDDDDEEIIEIDITDLV